MEISHLKSANTTLENDVLTKLNNVTAHINHLETQLQTLQQQNLQLAGENNDLKILAKQ
jgi:regulator of replication initiation timing